MPDLAFSKHAKHMLVRRKIVEEWVWRVINTPDKKWRGVDDNNMHYTKAIREKAGQVLHIVLNTNAQPNKIVTVFFDRRSRKKE